jgi:hypothetical protein
MYGLKRLRRDSKFCLKSAKSVPQGLKPGGLEWPFLPGINPRPTTRASFSAACEARTLQTPEEPCHSGDGFDGTL